MFAFAVSFDEAVIAYFVQSPDATTLPVKMFTDIRYDLEPTIAAVSSLLLLLTTVVIVVQMLMLSRRSPAALLPGTDTPTGDR